MLNKWAPARLAGLLSNYSCSWTQSPIKLVQFATVLRTLQVHLLSRTLAGHGGPNWQWRPQSALAIPFQGLVGTQWHLQMSLFRTVSQVARMAGSAN